MAAVRLPGHGVQRVLEPVSVSVRGLHEIRMAAPGDKSPWFQVDLRARATSPARKNQSGHALLATILDSCR